jgi:hypothetical protein
MPSLSEEARKAIKNDQTLFNLLKAAKHSLLSYAYGNNDKTLAEAVVDEIDKALAQVN